VTTRSRRAPVERPLAGAPGAPPLWLPDEPFPHVNTTADFRAMIGLE